MPAFGGPLFEKSIQSYWARAWKEPIQKVEEMERSVSIDFHGKVR
jgi:hypothetical protein